MERRPDHYRVATTNVSNSDRRSTLEMVEQIVNSAVQTPNQARFKM